LPPIISSSSDALLKQKAVLTTNIVGVQHLTSAQPHTQKLFIGTFGFCMFRHLKLSTIFSVLKKENMEKEKQASESPHPTFLPCSRFMHLGIHFANSPSAQTVLAYSGAG